MSGAIHPVLGISPDEVFKGRYRVRISIRDRICGGIPKSPEVQIKWLETKGFTHEEAEELVRARRAEIAAENGAADSFIAEEAERTWSGFRSDGDGLYIEARQVRALLRECAVELGIAKDNRGFRQRLQHGLFVVPPRLRLWRNGAAITEPDNNQLKVVHAWTPKGKIAAFSRFDFVEVPVEIEFELAIVQDMEVRPHHLKPMLLLAEEAGMGTNRSQGEGKFDVVVFEQLHGKSESEADEIRAAAKAAKSAKSR